MSTYSDRPLWRRLPKRLHAVTRSKEHRFVALRSRMAELLVLTAIVEVIGAALVFMFEKDAAGSDITNIGDALFWTAAQILTVSSSMSNPITTGGRVVDVFLMAYAVMAIGILIALFNRYLGFDSLRE